jgi:uncharacterized membrane protein
MGLLVPLASLLGIEIETLLDQLKRSATANLVVALFALIAFVFLLVAGFLALAGTVGPIVAALLFAAGSLLVALGVWFVMWIVDDRKKRREAERRHASETTALVTTAALTAIPMLIKSPAARNIALPLAGLIGLALSSASDGHDHGHGHGH